MSTRSSSSALALAGFALFFGLLGTLILWVCDVTLHSALLLGVAFVLLVPLVVRAVSGHLDVFEPIVLANLCLGVMFVGRPLTLLATGETDHWGYDVLPTFDEALFVSLVGILSFEVGYCSSFGRGWVRNLPAPPTFRPNRAATGGWLYLLVGGILFGAFLANQGGLALLKVLLEGRQQSNNELFLGATGYLYNGLLMWGASALIFFAVVTAGGRRAYWIAFLIPTVCLLVFYGARGARSQLLPLILAVPVFWFLWKGRRPAAFTLLIAAIAGVTLLGWMREIRTVDSNRDFFGTLAAAVTSPATEAVSILGGADTEMFDSLANELTILPERMPFQHGATITDLIVRAIPRPLWPGKPLESGDALVVALWPTHYEGSRASPAFSIIGSLYADSGYVTTGLGMFLIGAALAVGWRWLLRYQSQPVAQMIYAMGLPFIVILMRGTIPDTVARMLFLLFPLVLLMWSTRLGLRPSHSGA